VLVYCIISLFNCTIFVLSPALDDIHHTSMAQYSVFVLKVPLNTKQTNMQNKLYIHVIHPSNSPWISSLADLDYSVW